MRVPPLKAIEAVLLNRIDHRARRTATHFRAFFRCFDKDGNEAENEEDIARIELTQRAKEYWEQQNGHKRRIPSQASVF